MLKTVVFLISFLIYGSIFSQTFTRSELITDLSNPWEIIYGPDNYLWITQSLGRITRINPVTGEATEVYAAPDYFGGSPLEKSPYCFEPNIGAGTMGMALHPDFSNPETAYIYYVYSYNSGTETEPATKFKIRRLKWDATTATIVESSDIVTDIPTGYDHLGGRLLAVKRNGKPYLFLSVGDNGVSEQNDPDCYPDQMMNPNNWAQNPERKNGKIHRFNMDGSIPADNPIPGNSFYTRGHRNPQGLMYNTDLDILYDVEHGDRTDDEINVLYKGMNYGWKYVRGYHDGNHPLELDFVKNYVPHSEVKGDSLIPAFYSWCDTPVDGDPSNANWCTVAPSDGIYYSSNAIPQWQNSLLVVTLKDGNGTDKELYQFKLKANGELMPSTPENPNPKRFFAEDQDLNGRLRDIAISPDGTKIYLINNGGTTSGGSKITLYTLNPESVEPYTGENCVTPFPNPADVALRFRGIQNLTGITDVEVFTLSGELVKTYSSTVIAAGAAIKIDDLATGTYVAKITHADGVCAVQFFKY